MCLSDTAEYWQDIKAHFNRMPSRKFTHIPGADCGHYHCYEAKQLGNVDCYACLELIKNGYEHGLAPGTYLTHSERKRRVEQSKQTEFDNKNGRCSCGSRWAVRKNKTTGEEFLGCLSYPKCKKTKPFIK